jgi:membrane protein
VTAVLFVLGKWLIGLYLGHSEVGSAYGAAGTLLILLLWVYYSAQLLFFGAEFTQVYTNRGRAPAPPSSHARPVTTEARAQQGLPPRGSSGSPDGDAQNPNVSTGTLRACSHAALKS